MASDVARIYLVTDVLDNYKAIASKVKKQAKEAAKDAKIDLGIDIKDNEIEKALASINKRLGEKTFKEVNFSNITTSHQPFPLATLVRGEGESVFEVSIDGDSGFIKGDWFDPDAVVVISYY